MNRTTLLVLMLAIGCSQPLITTDRTPEGLDPFTVDETTLPDLSRQAVLERRAIFRGNILASEVFEEAANVQLNSLGIRARYVDTPLTPVAPREGEAIPETIVPASIDAETPAGTEELAPGACAFAIAPPAIDASAISCRYLARETLREATTRGVRRLADEPLPDSFMRGAVDPAAVGNWYEAAFDFGLSAGAPTLVNALRAVGACDAEPTQNESANERGITAGREIMAAAVAAQEAITPETVCNFDVGIVNPARSNAMGQIAARAEEPLCEGYVAADATERARLQAAQTTFADGIMQGIDEQAAEDSARLVRERVCVRPEPEGGGGGEGGGSGDPLVLDFDGDGLIGVDSIELGARFDFGGGEVSTQWPIGDALLVFDADGDGDIQASELFGDVSEFADGAIAADGLDAAALYDATERGGNADGRIDSSDAIYPLLSVWLDANGDAIADDGELTSLEDAGVAAIDFTHGRWFDADGTEQALGDVWLEYTH